MIAKGELFTLPEGGTFHIALTAKINQKQLCKGMNPGIATKCYK